MSDPKITPIRPGAQIDHPDANPGQSSVPPGGGGPYNTDMEARVAKLESDVSHIRSDLSEIKTLLARLAPKIDEMYGKLIFFATKEDIANLRSDIGKRPTRGQSIRDLSLIVAIIGGLLALGSKLAR